MGAGSGYTVGATGGSNEVSLSTNQIPSHNHGISDPGHTHNYWDIYHSEKHPSTNTNVLNNWGGNGGTDQDNRGFQWLRTSYGSGTGISIQSTGSGASHENRPPFYALAYIMKL